jgi:hypothetical protein
MADCPTGKSFEPPPNAVDQVARMMAVGNNGGEWAIHYNEHQKALWRWRAAGVISQVAALLQAHQPSK